jgi:hypothetical protein
VADHGKIGLVAACAECAAMFAKKTEDYNRGVIAGKKPESGTLDALVKDHVEKSAASGHNQGGEEKP